MNERLRLYNSYILFRILIEKTPNIFSKEHELELCQKLDFLRNNILFETTTFGRETVFILFDMNNFYVLHINIDSIPMVNTKNVSFRWCSQHVGITFSLLRMRRSFRFGGYGLINLMHGLQSVNIIKWYRTVMIHTRKIKRYLLFKLRMMTTSIHLSITIYKRNVSATEITKCPVSSCIWSIEMKGKRRKNLEIGHYLNQNVMYQCQNGLFQLPFNV